MKKFFKISIAAMAAMLALGGTSCQRDEQTTPPAGDASLRFSFATATQPGFVTRAEIATEFEWKIESIDIYAADTDGNLSLLVKDTDYTIDPDPATDNDATNREFNVTMTDEWIESPDNMGKQFTFYFVGNSTQTGNSQLAAITTEAAMKQALTVGETPDANGQIDLFNEPSATSLFLFTEVVEDVLLSGKQDVTGRLARRVARFDIENPTYDRTNEFVVDEIRVMNATDRGYIFRTAAPDFATDIDPTRADYVPLAGFPTDATAYTDVNGDGSQWLNLMSFYLYPTTIGKNNEAADNGGAGTQIVVRGTFKGQTVFVPVIVDRDVDILANTRYIITLDMASGRGTLQTVDWETGEQLGDNDLPAKPGENTEPADMLYIGGGSFTWDNTIHTLEVYSDNVTIQTSASFDAVSPFGTTFTVEHTVGGTDVSNTATAEVYSSSIQTTRAITLSTKERYLIKVPQGDTAIEATVTIHSNNNPEDDYVITVRRIPAGNANILHLDKDGALQVGNWTSGVVTLDNILMFKSGGVVGVGAAAVNDDLYDATKVLFNPASNVTPTDDWMSIPAFDVSDFVDEDNTYVNVESGYVTGTRIKEGKGDPCMLVGYTAQELRVMSESELDEVISNAEWRLPTSDEISTYVARSSNNDNSYWDATGINGFQGAWMPYNSITKTYGPDFYPAVGFRKPNSEGTNRGTTGAVNTSWASWTNQTTNNNGVYLGLLEQSLLTFIGNHDNSLTVRCVPNS